MPPSPVIGLTGGIGSGKSTVAGMPSDLGACVIDADAIVHELQAAGQPLLREIADAFGAHLIGPDGALDRKALGAIVHPAVGAEMARRLAAAHEAGAPLIVLDIPLLFEGRQAGRGGASQLDFEATVLVWVPRETQVERTMARDACTREEAESRIAAQLPLDEKRALADHVIDNSGSREQTADAVRALFAALSAPAPA